MMQRSFASMAGRDRDRKRNFAHLNKTNTLIMVMARYIAILRTTSIQPGGQGLDDACHIIADETKSGALANTTQFSSK